MQKPVASNIELGSLFHNEGFIQLTYMNSPNLMAVLDSSGEIKSVNSMFVEKLGYGTEEIINKNLSIISEDINLSLLQRALPDLSGGAWKSEIQAVNKEGKRLSLLAEISSFKKESGSIAGFLFSAEDRTEYNNLKEKLAERSFRLESIFKAFPDKLFLMNHEGIIEDYYISGLENLFIPPEQFLGKNFLDVLPEEAGKSLLSAFKKITETHSIVTYEYSVTIKKEERYYEGRLVSYDNGDILNIVRDITDKRKTEDEIQLLISALGAADNSIAITGSDGEIIWVNKAFETLTGYTLSEVKGKNPRLLKSGLHDDEIYGKLWNTIKSGHSWFGHLYNKRKDGSIYLDEQTITPIFDSYGRISNFIAIKHDRTFHKKLEEQLDFHLGLWNLISDAVIVTDRDFRITLWNKGAERLYGWKFGEVLGEEISRFINSDELNSQKIDIEKAGEINTEVIQKNKNGDSLWIYSTITAIRDSGNDIIGFINLNRDITDKKKMIEEISYDRGLLKSIFDSASDCILVLDKDKNIIMFNNAAAGFINLPSCELKGQKIRSVLAGYKLIGNIWEERIGEILSGGQVTSCEDSDLINDSLKYVKSVFFPVMDSGGKSILAGIIFSDITAEKMAEEKYLETEKLTTIGKMAAYVSHEMKTPLNSINMNIDILRNALQLPPVRQKSFDIIQKEVKRLSRLMKDILQFSRLDTLSRNESNICQVINNIKILLEPLLNKKNIAFTNRVEDVKVRFSQEKLESVFIHLIENSIDAVESGGEIIFYSQKDEERKRVKIFIKDDGCGIKEPAKIFQPFYTTKKDGTGLGMSIIRNILSLNQGEINLLSGKEGETIFEIILNI